MIKQKTVFVLGAGASAPWFPTGQDLLNLVSRSFAPGSPLRPQLLNVVPFGERPLDDFCYQVRLSGQPSVDLFLERREEFLDVGKATMACILLDNERRSDLWAEHQPSWMKYIFARMSAPFEEFQNNNITFVTFNYDRSLEHFFHTALKATYGKSDDECAETLKHIPVVHLHGRLGILPWQESSNIVTYGQALDAKTMEVCIRNIKVVHEDPADGRDAEFTRAKEALHQAERIFFLGFGFGERNVGRLGLAQLPDNRAAGTAYQLTSAEVQYISALCNNRVHLINNDCLNFCRGIAIWS